MMLFIDGISKGIYHENVGYYIQDYESAFDRLTQLVSDDWILEFAIIMDDGQGVTLPVEAFDGQPMLKDIRALQQQWNELLSVQPAQRASLPLQKDRYLQLDAYYGGLLAYLGKLIFLRRNRLSALQGSQNELLHSRLISQRQRLLDSTSYLYEQTVEHRYQNWQRLQALEVQDS